MYKRILVAIDGSDTSNLALQEAIKLAKDQHSILRLFHVVDLTMAYSTVEAPYVLDYRKAMEAGGQKVVADCAEVVRAARIEFDSKCEVVFGTYVYEAIEEEATAWGADLVVIGTHGRRGIRRLLLGSVAEGVTRISNRPVLLIRGR
jgi:nucleotide-binding universal stress UspA family protein